MQSRLPIASVKRLPVLTGRSRRDGRNRHNCTVSRRHPLCRAPSLKVVFRSVAGEGEEPAAPPVLQNPAPPEEETETQHVDREESTAAPVLQDLETPEEKAEKELAEKDVWALIDRNEMWRAERLFGMLEDKPLELYNHLIKGLQMTGQFGKCWMYYQQLTDRGIRPNSFTLSIMLTVCSKQKNTRKAMRLWKEAEKFEPDRVLYNSLIQVFTSADYKLDRAIALLEEMKSKGVRPDAVTYNTLISGFGRAERNTKESTEKIQALLKEMKEVGLEPDAYTYRALIRIALRRGELETSVRYITEMIDKNIPVKTGIFVSIINECARHRSIGGSNQIMAQCWRIYQEIEKNTPLVPMETYEALLLLFLSRGHWKKVFGLLEIMRERDVTLNRDVYSILLKGLGNSRSAEQEAAIVAEVFVEEMKTTRVLMTGEIYAHLVQIFLNAKQMDRAQFFFDELKRSRSSQQAPVYRLFLEYLSEPRFVTNMQASLKKILALLSEMRRLAISITLNNYIAIIRGCANCNDWNAMDEVLGLMQQDGMHPPVRSYSLILHMCARSEERERVQSAWVFFDDMKRLNLRMNVVIYTTMIHVCDILDDLEGGLNLMEEMKAIGIFPNEHTYTSLVHLAGKAADVAKMEELFKEYKNSDLQINTRTYGALIHGYGVNNQIDKVQQIHAELKEKGVKMDLPLFCNLIQSASQCERIDLIYQFYDEFSSGKLPMDHTAYTILSKALEKNGDFEGAAAVLELEKEEKEKGGRVSLVA